MTPPEPPPSIYAVDADWPGFGTPPQGDQQVDIAVVGGGFTGISTALNLAEDLPSISMKQSGSVMVLRGAMAVRWFRLDNRFSKSWASLLKPIAWSGISVSWAGYYHRPPPQARIDPDLRFGYLYGAAWPPHARADRNENRMEDWGYGELEFAPDKASLKPHINTDAYVGGL